MPDKQYPIPQKSAIAINAIKAHQPHNPGLVFERFAPNWGAAPKREQPRCKKEGLEAVTQYQADKAALQAYGQRWQAIAAKIQAIPFSLKTDWRFIPGLGRKGPLEVGFSFHRYGFPILPGSSVKGLARAWAFFQIVELVGQTNLEDLEKNLCDGEEECKKFLLWRKQQSPAVQKMGDEFRTIFGTTTESGKAVFLDAIPASPPKLELDVINPHFPKYYSGGENYPTDWQSPVPVTFLTVAAGQEFMFAVGWSDKDNSELRGKANAWLKESLQNLGAGAKTSAGYGYFG